MLITMLQTKNDKLVSVTSHNVYQMKAIPMIKGLSDELPSQTCDVVLGAEITYTSGMDDTALIKGKPTRRGDIYDSLNIFPDGAVNKNVIDEYWKEINKAFNNAMMGAEA